MQNGMMRTPVKIISGDLLQLFDGGKFDLIMHGCNCFASMSGGIARAIAQRYPLAKEADKEAVARLRAEGRSRSELLGTFSACALPQGRILNLYTQYYPGPDFRDEAFREALRLVKKEFSGCRMGLPWIGCGIGGARRSTVYALVEDELGGQDVTIVELEARIKSLLEASVVSPLHRAVRPVFNRL